MACNNNCSDNCTDCNDCSSDCYDYGCLNPTTFECVTKPGTHEDIGVTNDMTGTEVLEAINTTIKNLVLPSPSSADIYSKVSATDTTSNYLTNKLVVGTFLTKTILNPAANEQIRFNLDINSVISADADNELALGTDGKLRVLPVPVAADIQVVAGSGVTVSGTGPASDPFIVSINPSITAARTCFDGVWNDLSLIATGTGDVTYVSGTPKYRIRFDGSIEFKGSATYIVNFGAYSTSGRKRTITLGALPTTCLNLSEQTGTSDLKSINYIDQPGSGDQITQMNGFIIRKINQNILVEFQSSYITSTTKTIVVSFDGAISHPNI